MKKWIHATDNVKASFSTEDWDYDDWFAYFYEQAKSYGDSDERAKEYADYQATLRLG